MKGTNCNLQNERPMPACGLVVSICEADGRSLAVRPDAHVMWQSEAMAVDIKKKVVAADISASYGACTSLMKRQGGKQA